VVRYPDVHPVKPTGRASLAHSTCGRRR
jgi:hypothetical protein